MDDIHDTNSQPKKYNKGGKREGAGRPDGTGSPTVNKVLRVPTDLMEEPEIKELVGKREFNKTAVEALRRYVKSKKPKTK